jgi:hypothetical protein
MALTDENGGMSTTMLVSPAGNMGFNGGFGNGGFGFGGDWAWILLLLLIGGNGWGMGGFGGGYGAMMGAGMMGLGYDFPWLLAGQNNINNNVSDGFRDAQLHDSVTSVRDGISALSTQLCGCCGDMQMTMANGFAGVNQNVSQTGNAIQNAVNQGFASTNLGMCQGFNGVNTAISGAQNAISQQLNTNEIANLNRSFAEQTANAQGFNGLNAGVADLRYTVAIEACADRAAVGDALQNVTMQNMANTNQIVNALNAGIQSIKDDLCADRLDAERRENQNLRSELMYARGQASQVEQTAQIRASQATTANQLVNELRSCPIPSQPVYGNQPIFTCPQNQYSPCGCNGNNF